MNHLLICGAAGFTNLGDDAILWGMLTQLRARLGDVAVQVAGGPHLAPLADAFGATPISYDDREELARAIEGASLVLLGGGGMLYDTGYHASLSRLLTDPPDRQWLYELARIAAAAGAAGRPLMLYSVGVGPLLTNAAREVVRFIAEQSKCIAVRDSASADLLAQCGVPSTRVHVAADPAVLVAPAPSQRAERWLSATGLASCPRPWVAVNLRPWYHFGQPAEGGEDPMQRLIDRAAAVVRGIGERLGGTPVMLPFQQLHDDDRALAADLLARAGTDTPAIILEPDLTPPDVIAAVSQFDLVVGMRTHVLLTALAAGVPFVSLSYSSKVDEVAKAAGLADHLHPVDDLDAEAVLASCQSILTHPQEARAGLSRALAEIQDAARIAGELAEALLKGPASQARPPLSVPAGAVDFEAPRVLMWTRPDYREKPGGDVVQLEELLPFLRDSGVQADLTGDESPDLSAYDLVHTINLDRPQEPYLHCLKALESGLPSVVSPVHTDMSEFLEWGDPDYWELPDPGAGLPRPRPAPLPGPVERRRRALQHQQRQAILDWATAYLPNSQTDADYLHAVFGMDLSRTVVIHHGISPMFFDARPEPFVEKYGLRDFVLCGAARVEARKNQLSLIAALRGTGLPLVIVGQPNPESYRDLCRRYADDNVVFIDAMPQSDLASAFAAAKVHALVSWFEVPGLVSLEAGAAGCNIVSTDRGSPREYLSDLAWFCDPRDTDSIRQAVQAAYDAPRSGELRERIRRNYTWEQAAQRTLEGYRLALAVHRQQSVETRGEGLTRALRQHADWLAHRVDDREYELRQVYRRIADLEGHTQHLEQWGRRWEEQSQALKVELERWQGEFEKVTSRRLFRWSEAAARMGWRILRLLGVKP